MITACRCVSIRLKYVCPHVTKIFDVMDRLSVGGQMGVSGQCTGASTGQTFAAPGYCECRTYGVQLCTAIGESGTNCETTGDPGTAGITERGTRAKCKSIR